LERFFSIFDSRPRLEVQIDGFRWFYLPTIRLCGRTSSCQTPKTRLIPFSLTEVPSPLTIYFMQSGLSAKPHPRFLTLTDIQVLLVRHLKLDAGDAKRLATIAGPFSVRGEQTKLKAISCIRKAPDTSLNNERKIRKSNRKSL